MTKKAFSLVSGLFSAVFIVAGIYAIVQGLDAADVVRERITAENIVTAEDSALPNVLVDGYDAAVAQADVIGVHALEATDGQTYAEMDREDPNREIAAKAASLRTSLYSTAMAFKLSELVTYLGAAFVALGLFGAYGTLVLRRV